MKIFRYLFLLLLLTFFETYSQDSNSFVLSLPVNNDRLNNKIEELNLPILYLNEYELVTIATSENINVFELIGVNYSLIDKHTVGDKYYLINSKLTNDISTKLQESEIVYKDIHTVVARNLSMSFDDFLTLGLSVNEINLNNTFKNVKRIWKQNLPVISDSLITQITSLVNDDSVRFFIQSLQDFQTRFLFANTRDAVAQWIKNQFLQMGLTDVVLDSFQYQGTWQKNVVATLPGLYEPEVYNIVGGHHDSYSSGDPMVFAPGADDNASGTAAVLEMARVIMSNGYQPESTIKFITFAAEEYGLWGSKDYAEKAFNEGMNIKIMINHDMISHTYYPANQSEVDINRYSGFDYLRDLAFYCIENYSVLSPRNGSLNSSGSDSHSFWQRGFPSVYYEETNFSPYYHSPADTIGNYSMEYCAEVIKASCATLLMNIVMPTMVQDYQLVDAGSGNSLLLKWSPNQSPDLANYKIYLGTQPGVYDSIYTTVDTIFTVGNLTEGVLYYAGVSAVDQDGYESLIVERSATPFELPFAPKGFTANPMWHQVDLSWQKSMEYDLLGYNIYRSIVQGELGERVNQVVYQDTLYMDNNASNGVYYYYTVKAVDSLLNESLDNTTLRSRVVSLDQGILIVDETTDGDGTLLNPTDQQVDEFYEDILNHFNTQQYDMIQENEIGLADLGAFSTVIWHGNDISDLTAPFDYKEEIGKYLDFGGNFLYTGYRPSKAFEKYVALSGSFSSGDFIYDYLKIEQFQSSIFSLFNEAKGIEFGYSNIFVDSLKILPSNDYHLKDVEKIQASSEGIEIYLYGTNFDSTTQQGLLKGEPIAVEYIGNDYKTITLSFPLYYMNKEQAKSLFEYVLTNKFDEVMPVNDLQSEIPSSYNLYQNYPNPFNPSTTIAYNLPEEGYVKLAVYSMLGEEITTLVNNVQKAGNYQVRLNAEDFASGVYIYRIETVKYSASKKLILLK